MLKEIVHPTLEAKQIIVRTDKDENSYELERSIGVAYPLIRILDRTLDHDNIESFVYKIGAEFLPEISVLILDEENRLREKLKSNIDTITVYLSNNIDGTFSKQEYILTSVNSSPDSNTISLQAMLYVPSLFNRNMRAIESNSMDVLKTICTEIGLGLSSNFTPNDIQVRIQDNLTNLDFIRNIINTSQCEGVHAFIDQWSYLNFIDMKKAYQSDDVIEYTIHPMTGDDLPKPQKLYLTNNPLETDAIGRIEFWASNDDYGVKSLAYVNSYLIEKFDRVDLINTDNIELTANSDEIRQSKRKHLISDENVWSGYMQSKYYGRYLKDTLNQSSQLAIRMRYPLHALHAGLTLNVEIFDNQKRNISSNQDDTSMTLEEVPTELGEGSTKLEKNPLYSGRYYLNEIELTYIDRKLEQRLYLRQI